MLKNVTDMLLGPATSSIGMYPLKSFYDGKNFLNNSTVYLDSVYFEYLFRILILCFSTALHISVMTEGDPREFYIGCYVNTFRSFKCISDLPWKLAVCGKFHLHISTFFLNMSPKI